MTMKTASAHNAPLTGQADIQSATVPAKGKPASAGLPTLALAKQSVSVPDALNQIPKLRDNITALEVVDEESAKIVTETGTIAARLIKSLDDERKKHSDPLEKEKKAIIAFFKQVIDPLEVIKAMCGNKLTAYRVAERKKAEEEQRRMQEILDKQHEEELQTAEANRTIAPAVGLTAVGPVVENTVKSDTGSASGQRPWTFEVTDFSALVKAVVEGATSAGYLAVNEKEIRGAIRDGVREIPGVRIFQDDRTSFR